MLEPPKHIDTRDSDLRIFSFSLHLIWFWDKKFIKKSSNFETIDESVLCATMRFRSKMHSNWWAFALLLIICCNLSVVELKRSFGIGRSRPKASNPSVRRRGHNVAEPQRPAPQPKTASAPAGPPPAYTPHGNANAPKSNVNEPPPSYAQATNSFSNANYPRQSYAGVNSGTNNMYHPQAPPSYGGSNFGHSPYHNAGPYGGGGMPMAGGFSPGYGGGMPMGGGFGYGPSYQRSSSPMSGLTGNLLTGLAVWQLTRAFSGGNNHNTHIYHHYDNNNQPSSMYAGGVQPQQSYAGGAQTQAVIPVVPATPDQTPAVVVPNTTTIEQPTANQSGHTNQAETATPIPEFDQQFAFSTIHPSLFPYGRRDESLEYWATKNMKKLQTTSPDTSDSAIMTSTTTTAAEATTKSITETPEITTITQATTTTATATDVSA